MIKKIQYEHSYYEGNVVNGKFHGKGIYFWNNGDRYEGEWFEGDMHGYGIRYYTNGSFYEGNWFHDKKHGSGIYYEYSKSEKVYNNKFVGEWINGKKEGLFENYRINRDGTYSLNAFQIYKNDDLIESHFACALKLKGILSKDSFVRYINNEQNLIKQNTVIEKSPDEKLTIGTIIDTKKDAENYSGPYFITGCGRVPHGEGKSYEYEDIYGECTFEHVGQWYDGRRHGVFERYKNTGDWENLELYSFDVYQYGKLIDRFYITDLEEKGVYNKIQFINYYSKLQLKKFR